MKARLYFLIPVVIVVFCSAKSVIEIFTLNKFEESLSKITDRFYMSKYEVTNLQYMTFLADLRSCGMIDKYNISNIDSLQWRDKYAYNEPYVELYHRHPAYNQYPVVNISYEGAVLFCEWLTEKYNSYEKRKFKKVVYRLPTKEEWENAAHGGLKGNDYPWGSFYLNDCKGRIMCNYKEIGDEWIHYNKDNKSYSLIEHSDPYSSCSAGADPAPVTLYFPNGLGIYNISGNVAEMISEKGVARGGSYLNPGYDVRIESSEKYSHPQRNIGFRVCMDVIETWK